ncbi:unnamed protein product [Didymodactylos carnosus]|uniref:Uncharacterized protein n=1 Tax=Didymodactylos carnosus TaxID=1234261 RepID=A0A8S2FMH6_9BILA|nr:unnamed protein product [Didymodactylos carnosus]CAF4297006.1 unnamed protein product [Didymodactylos carnosus]
MENISDLNDSISKAFDVVITSLTEETLDSSAIERQFNELSEQITDFEGVSYPHFIEHRYRFHLLRLGYYEKMKNEEKRKKEEKLLLKYTSLRSQNVVKETFIGTDQTSNNKTKDDSESSWEIILNLVSSLVQSQNTDQITNTLKKISQLLISIFQHPIQTLDQYYLLQNNCKNVQSLFETLKVNELDTVLEENNHERVNNLDLLIEIIDLVLNSLENRQEYFANILLSDLPHLDEMLFY